MSQLTKLEEVASGLLAGIMANPNYNFGAIEKSVANAIEHAKELLAATAGEVEVVAKEVAVVATKVSEEAGKVKAALSPSAPASAPAAAKTDPAASL